MSCCRDGTNSFLFYIPPDVLLPVPIMFSDVIPQALLPVLSDAQCAIFLRMKFPGNGTSSEMSYYQSFTIGTCAQVNVREATRGQAVQRKLPCNGPPPKATFAINIVLGFLYLSCPIPGTNRFLSIILLLRDRSQVISEYVEGKQTRKQLAERYGVSVRTIERHQSHGLPQMHYAIRSTILFYKPRCQWNLNLFDRQV